MRSLRNLLVKHTIALTLGMTWITLSMAQERWIPQVYINPCMFKLGNNYIQRSGLQLYKTKADAKWQAEVGVRLNRPITTGLELGVGISLRNMSYNLSTYVTSPVSLNSTDVIDIVGGNIDMIMASPSVNINYKKHRFTCSVGLDWSVPLNTSYTFEDIYSRIYAIVEPPEKITGIISIQTFIPPKRDLWRKFILPNACIFYDLSSAISIHLGAKIKFYGKDSLYGIRIDGYTTDMGTKEFTYLHGSLINTKVLEGYLGIDYLFGK